jgi:hypothetical protein
MSKRLFSSIDIEAPAEQVWKVLTDFEAFPAWNPFITHAEGRLEVGARLKLRMQPVRGTAVTLRPTLVEVIDGRRLRWVGRLGVGGLFDAEHLFVVETRGAAGSRLVQQEQFGGLLVPFLARSLDRGTLPAFHAMNDALKDRAEKATAARA